MGIIEDLGLFPTSARALSNHMFTEIDHAPWQARQSKLSDNSNKFLQEYYTTMQINSKSLSKLLLKIIKIKKLKQRENKALLINNEESFGNPKRMATNSPDSVLGNGMGFTCKHEFQSWTCVAVMKIQPPLKVERE